MTRYLGVDLAWGEGSAAKAANETGLVCVDSDGTVVDATWARGVKAVAVWLETTARPGDVIAIDAPLVVTNETGMRECEREVAQRYGRWKVAANSSNLTRAWLGGVTLRLRLEALGYVYSNGIAPVDEAITFFECYPDTTLVGAPELGYEEERPRYKRFNNALPDVAAKRAFRASECDEFLRRVAGLAIAAPALNLASHPITADLLNEPSPLSDVPYKHREDLLDAALCAWTAALWSQFGEDRCQVLGRDDIADAEGRVATIIAPARPEQRARRERGSTAPRPTYRSLLETATEVLKRPASAGNTASFATAKIGLLAALAELEIRAAASDIAE